MNLELLNGRQPHPPLKWKMTPILNLCLTQCCFPSFLQGYASGIQACFKYASSRLEMCQVGLMLVLTNACLYDSLTKNPSVFSMSQEIIKKYIIKNLL